MWAILRAILKVKRGFTHTNVVSGLLGESSSQIVTMGPFLISAACRAGSLKMHYDSPGGVDQRVIQPQMEHSVALGAECMAGALDANQG